MVWYLSDLNVFFRASLSSPNYDMLSWWGQKGLRHCLPYLMMTGLQKQLENSSTFILIPAVLFAIP